MRVRFGIILVAVIALAACGVGGPEIKTANQQPRQTQTPTEKEISGVFNITGSGANEMDPYTGLLEITRQGDLYGFRWTLNRGTRVGHGVQIGDATAASFSTPGSGRGCGVVLYKIAGDGSMEGRAVRWGEANFGTEKAVRTDGRTFAGTYEVTGKQPDGVEYAGRLVIKKDGEGYDFEWKTGTTSLVAFGTWQGSYAAASFGGRQCGFALYSVLGGRNLEGVWGGQKAVTIGTEKASRK
jgi:hypothetical protein